MIFQLDIDQVLFPHPKYAEQDGLLAIGGDLSVARLLVAYQNGIFPWYSDESPILWYAPHERFVLFPADLQVSKSMRKIIKQGKFRLSHNQAFEQVIGHCADTPRANQDGTWITQEMQAAYLQLHAAGHAHSIEVWQDQLLVGGLYGVQIGDIFCGESMFSHASNASKLALIYLTQHFNFTLIDCQIYSEHLESLGAKMIPQQEYLSLLVV